MARCHPGADELRTGPGMYSRVVLCAVLVPVMFSGATGGADAVPAHPAMAPAALLAGRGPSPQSPDSLFEPLLRDFMEGQGIGAGALAISKDGRVVYELTMGWQDRERTVPLPSSVMMRIASLTKPITAAAIRKLADDRKLGLDDRVFDVTGDGTGLLRIEPFPQLGDPRIGDITVNHLLQHRGGWDRDSTADFALEHEIRIARALSVPSPPGPLNTMRYVLGRPLQFDPGTREAYSNIGYLVLGLIIEEISGQDYMTYVHDKVFAPLGVPAGDVVQGRTFPADRDPREPWYDPAGRVSSNAFNPSGPLVPVPDGGWDHESTLAFAGLVASPRAVLRFLAEYQMSGDDIGTGREGREGAGWWRYHTGRLRGVEAVAFQRGNGFDFVVFLNRAIYDDASYSHQIGIMIDLLLRTREIRWSAGY